MTLCEFKAMDEQEQIEAIWNKGVLLSQRKLPIADFYLYQIDGFYIEMKYLPDSDNIIGLKSFKTIDLLEPYLELININTEN